MIGDSAIAVDNDPYITIKERVFRGSKGLWELSNCKNVNTEFIAKDFRKTYKKILMATNAHFTQRQH